MENTVNRRSTPDLSAKSSDLLDESDLETVLIKAVRDDPFVTISELKHILRITGQFESVSWWRIFSVLRRKRLLRRRSRFRLARGGR